MKRVTDVQWFELIIEGMEDPDLVVDRLRTVGGLRAHVEQEFVVCSLLDWHVDDAREDLVDICLDLFGEAAAGWVVV